MRSDEVVEFWIECLQKVTKKGMTMVRCTTILIRSPSGILSNSIDGVPGLSTNLTFGGSAVMEVPSAGLDLNTLM